MYIRLTGVCSKDGERSTRAWTAATMYKHASDWQVNLEIPDYRDVVLPASRKQPMVQRSF